MTGWSENGKAWGELSGKKKGKRDFCVHPLKTKFIEKRNHEGKRRRRKEGCREGEKGTGGGGGYYSCSSPERNFSKAPGRGKNLRNGRISQKKKKHKKERVLGLPSPIPRKGEGLMTNLERGES